MGVGLVIMLSSMLVATMTGLPRRRQPCTMRDCQKGTCTRMRMSQLGGKRGSSASDPIVPLNSQEY